MTLTALMVALAVIFHYVEGFIPVLIAIPGFKLGLANIVGVVRQCEAQSVDPVERLALHLQLYNVACGECGAARCEHERTRTMVVLGIYASVKLVRYTRNIVCVDESVLVDVARTYIVEVAVATS